MGIGACGGGNEKSLKKTWDFSLSCRIAVVSSPVFAPSDPLGYWDPGDPEIDTTDWPPPSRRRANARRQDGVEPTDGLPTRPGPRSPTSPRMVMYGHAAAAEGILNCRRRHPRPYPGAPVLSRRRRRP